MKRQLFGRSGVEVSELCLGTMTFGDDARRVLDAFLDAGGTFLDVLPASELLVGEALRGRRDRVVLGTKLGRGDTLDESLTRLGTDHVDVAWTHAWDAPAELARRLEDMLASGKARAVGIADAPAWTVAHASALARCDGVILEYGLAARDAERELLPMCAALGITPLAWGLLSGDWLVGDAQTRADSSGDYYARCRAAAAQRVAPVLRDLAAARGVSAAALAIAWAAQRVVPVLGPKNERELRERLGALTITVDDEARDALEAATRIDLGFPGEYLRDPAVRREIYGV